MLGNNVHLGIITIFRRSKVQLDQRNTVMRDYFVVGRWTRNVGDVQAGGLPPVASVGSALRPPGTPGLNHVIHMIRDLVWYIKGGKY